MYKLTILLLLASTAYSVPPAYKSNYHQQQPHDVEHQHVDHQYDNQARYHHHQPTVKQPLPGHHEELPHYDDNDSHMYQDVSARHNVGDEHSQDDEVVQHEVQAQGDHYKFKDTMPRHHVEGHDYQSTYHQKTVEQKPYVHQGVESHQFQSPVQPKSFVHHSSVGHHVAPKPQVYSKQQFFGHVEPVDHVAVMPRHMSDNPVASARIVMQDSEVNPDGSFSNVWSSDNGINVQEQGLVKSVGDLNVAVVDGQYSYTDDEGHEYHVKYTADENGFQPQGDHLPTPPPIPAGIARGLEYIANHPYVETTTYNSQDQYYHQQGVSS